MDYRSSTSEGQEMLDNGTDPRTVAEFDRLKTRELAARALDAATPAFAARHPDAANAETFAQMGAVLASEPEKFAELAIVSPDSALEIAYGRAQQMPAPSTSQSAAQPQSGGRRTGAAYDPGLDPFAQEDERRARARQTYERTGSMVQAARSVGYRVSHPDFDNEA